MLIQACVPAMKTDRTLPSNTATRPYTHTLCGRPLVPYLTYESFFTSTIFPTHCTELSQAGNN